MTRKHSKKKETGKKLSDIISYKNFILSPVVPGPEVKDLCNRIDDFYKNYSKIAKKQKPSDLIKGAFYATRLECRSNPDWMSQAANSAREVLYSLFREEKNKNNENFLKLFRKYVINKDYK